MALFYVERMGTENTEKNGWERMGTDGMDGNGWERRIRMGTDGNGWERMGTEKNCDFPCFHIDISFSALNFIKIELSFMVPIIHTSIIGTMEFSIRT